MSTELIVSTADLAMMVTELQTKADDLLAQAERAEVGDQKAYEKGTDFRKIVSGIKKRADDKRKELVEPSGRRVRTINAEFKKVKDTLDQADTAVKTKMLGWYSAEQQRIREENELKRKAAEETALAAAEKVEEEGDASTAEAILNMASEVPKADDRPAIGRGELTGATSVASTVWTGRVDNIKHACRAIADGHLPVDTVTFSQSKLNALARQYHENHPDAEEIAQHGILFYGEARLSVR